MSAPAADIDAPTILGPDPEPPPSPSAVSLDTARGSSSGPAVRIGLQPRFEDETVDLLRGRLAAAAAALAVAFLFTFTMSGGWAVPLIGLRFSMLAVILAAGALLRFGPDLSLFRLRAIELVMFGAVAATMLAVELRLTLDFAKAGDAPAAAASKRSLIAAYTGLIMVYGMFVPNGWKRALAVLLPVAALPFVLFALLPTLYPDLAAALDADRAAPMIPGPVLAAAISAYGTHSIQRLRREAFKARRFGQYVLGERIGGGGMGEVFRAEHRLLKRPCAIKLIRPGSEADRRSIDRFEREVRATARLTHWNTIEVYDYGRTDDGAFYCVMELLRGLSLEDLVRRHGPLPPGRAVHLLRQVCRALSEAHAAGLVHRDIKPANVFAASIGGVHDVSKLLDFGLARQADDLALRPGVLGGTPLYMPPEQAADFTRTDARADLYALGAVAYYLLTGRPPFTRETLTDLLRAHATDPPPPLGLAVPADLEAVVLKCLAKRPEDRFPDAASLEAALASCGCAGDWTERDAAAWWDRASDSAEALRSPHESQTATAAADSTA